MRKLQKKTFKARNETQQKDKQVYKTLHRKLKTAEIRRQ